jgi:hypothetical protein
VLFRQAEVVTTVIYVILMHDHSVCCAFNCLGPAVGGSGSHLARLRPVASLC